MEFERLALLAEAQHMFNCLIKGDTYAAGYATPEVLVRDMRIKLAASRRTVVALDSETEHTPGEMESMITEAVRQIHLTRARQLFDYLQKESLLYTGYYTVTAVSSDLRRELQGAGRDASALDNQGKRGVRAMENAIAAREQAFQMREHAA